MKLSDENKKEIIRLNKEEGVSQKHLAKMFGIGIRHIADLLAKYNLHGEEALIKGPNRKYSPEFKMEVIKQYLNGESKNSLCVTYNIRYTMLDSWIERYEKGGYNGLIDKKKGRSPKMKIENDDTARTFDEIKDDGTEKARIRLLEKKNRELEAEIAYLKKLNALVQERKKRESKKK